MAETTYRWEMKKKYRETGGGIKQEGSEAASGQEHLNNRGKHQLGMLVDLEL